MGQGYTYSTLKYNAFVLSGFYMLSPTLVSQLTDVFLFFFYTKIAAGLHITYCDL